MNIYKKIFLIIYQTFAGWLNIFPDIFLGNRIRRFFYKFYLKKMGKNVIINSHVLFEVPENIEIGDYSTINRSCWFSGGGGLIIGNDVLIGPNVIIHTANHNFENSKMPFRLQGHTYKSVTIKNNVWIGAGAIILPGVIINSNSIIAAGAVVTKDVAEGVIVGGIPARILKMLAR